MDRKIIFLTIAALLLGHAPGQVLPAPVSIKRTGTNGADVELRFASLTGQSYRIFRSGTLATGSWTDTTVSAAGTGAELVMTVPQAGNPPRQFFKIEVSSGTGPAFVTIPAGTFAMGNQSDPGEGSPNELPVIQVPVSGFQMQSTEVTKAQWDLTYAYAIVNGYTFANAGLGVAGNHPVHTINWYDAVKWCNAKSQQDGLEPCYYVNTTLYKTGSPSSVRWDPTKDGYRLPTEAEWEKAARGSLTAKRFPWGDLIDHTRANYNANPSLSYDSNPTTGPHPAYVRSSFPYSSPAGSFAGNGYGLHDMTGNMLEWCWDRPTSNYSSGYAIDLTSSSSLFERVLRGGSWLGQASVARISRRGSAFPDTGRGTDIGFRIVKGRLQ